jgi:formylglycine-generating enzyme required for sulfatase activity
MKPLLTILLSLTLALSAQAQNKTLEVTSLPSGTERRVAVIFANQNYQFNPLDLSKTYNDADDMKAALQRLGFKVLVFKRDLTRSVLNRELLQLETTLRGYDVAFFYYSGHGGSYGNENFLLPTDIEPLSDAHDMKTFGISLDQVYEAFRKAQVKTGIVISDACRGFGIGKSALGPGMKIPANNPAGTFTLFATRQGDIAKENLQGRNSYFTQELLKHLETPNLTLNQIYYRTRQGVKTATAHFPHPQEPGIANELDDEFVLIQRQTQPVDDAMVVTPKSEPIVLPPGITNKPTPAKTSKFLDLPFAEMAYVEGGTFQMGTPQDAGYHYGTPIATVTVSSFYMGKYEVTQRQWEEIMGSNPSHFKANSKEPSIEPFSTPAVKLNGHGDQIFEDCLDCPVENVSWNDVQEFLKKLNEHTGGNFRLPTEAEWEYAAGGGSTNRTRFGNGRDIVSSAEANISGRKEDKFRYSIIGESRHKPTQVGTFRANRLGLHDMCGNVEEMCSDWYDQIVGGRKTNPTGPLNGEWRITRGGAFNGSPQFVPVTYRKSCNPSKGEWHIGFRVVSPAQ